MLPNKFTQRTSPAQLLAAGLAALATMVSTPSRAQVMDAGFNPGGSFNAGAIVKAVAVQADGKVIFGGHFTYSGTYPNGYPFTANHLVRFNSNGTVDTSYNPSPNYPVRALVLQSDGKLIVGGQFTSIGGYNQTYLARLHPGGSADYNTFTAPTPNGYVNAVALLADGKVVLGGEFTTLNGFSYARVACVNTNGSLVTTFNPGVAGAAVHSIAVYPLGSYNGGNIIIGGEFYSVGGLSRANVARLYSGGAVDSSFNAIVVVNGIATYVNATVYAVATAFGPFGCDGGGSCEKVLIGGAFVNFGDPGRDYFARLSQNGTGDYAAETPSLVDAPIRSIRVESNHKFYLTGSFTKISNGATRLGVARFKQADPADQNGWGISLDSWAGGAGNVASGGTVETISGSGPVYIGGSFTHIEGNARPRIARLLP